MKSVLTRTIELRATKSTEQTTMAYIMLFFLFSSIGLFHSLHLKGKSSQGEPTYSYFFEGEGNVPYQWFLTGVFLSVRFHCV